MEPFAKRPRVEGPGAAATPAAEVITFHLLKKDAAGQVVLEEDGAFPPEYTHQLFGDKEEIVGYDGLSVDIWLTPQFQTFIDVKFAAKGPGATELKQPFSNAFEAGFFEEKAQFDTALKEEKGIDVGLLGWQVASQETEEGTTFGIYHTKLAAADPDLKALHARFQPLLYFFVDGANGIDQDDPNWHLLMAVEQSEEGVEVLGFATLYRYYHYPEGTRLRLSQILVLPPHQGRGVGSMLLQAAQGLVDEMGACDLSYEEPAEALQALRTVLDVRRALELVWAQATAAERIAAFAAGKGKAPVAAAAAAANGSSHKAAKLAVGADHPLAAPPGVLARLRAELRLSKLQAGVVWRTLLYVAGKGEETAAEGVRGMILQQIAAQMAAAKEDAQGKSVRDTDKGFVMCRGAAATKSGIPLIPVEEQSAEQQAEAVEEAAEAQLEAVRSVAAKLLSLQDEAEEE